MAHIAKHLPNLYYVAEDYQGTNWAFGIEQTAEAWREMAEGWAKSDDNENLVQIMQNLQGKDENLILGEIADFWQIRFEKVGADYNQYRTAYNLQRTNLDYYEWHNARERASDLLKDLKRLCKDILDNPATPPEIATTARELLGEYI